MVDDESSRQLAAARAMTKRMIEKLRDELLERGFEEEAKSLEEAARRKLSPKKAQQPESAPASVPLARVTKPA